MAVVDEIRQADPRVAPGREQGPQEPDWVIRYLYLAMALDLLSMLAAGAIAFVLRFPGMPSDPDLPYIAFTIILPLLFLPVLGLCRAYQPRYVGVGWEEFHRVLRGGFLLMSMVAIAAYATKTEVARGYVVMALPLGTFLALLARYRLRKWLHKKRWNGQYMRRVIAVGHRTSVEDLIKLLRQKRYHGMDIVGVCLPPALASGDDA
ncbi:nucleoside-diphosphate sugar epimerase/dehydratase, partial [Actinomadura adrarensis]